MKRKNNPIFRSSDVFEAKKRFKKTKDVCKELGITEYQYYSLAKIKEYIETEIKPHELDFGNNYIVKIPKYSIYHHPCIPERLEYIEQFDGFRCYDENECWQFYMNQQPQTVGKIMHPCSEFFENT